MTLGPGKHDGRIRLLEDQLWDARGRIISLLPAKLKTQVKKYRGIKSKTDLSDWLHDTANCAWKIAKPTSRNSDRFICPACNDERDFQHSALFSHLIRAGNVRHCGVMGHMFALAREHLDSKETT